MAVESSGRKTYILIVDGDDISRQLFHAIFHKYNFELKFCSTAEQALNEIRNQVPELLITEIVLAGLNGFELRKRVHLIQSDLPIIFVSAVFDSASRKLLENLANEKNTFFLRKPIMREPLLELVNNILNGVQEREKTRRYFEQIQSDLSLASQMQKLMLPDWITLEDDNFYITANYVPYSHLSGDYFDMSVLADGRYFYVIGDISGHGVKAALHMSVVQSLTKLFARNAAGENILCEYLSNMNRQICANFDGVFHLTCLAAIIDPRDHSVEFISAGHPGFWLGSPENPTMEYLAPDDHSIPLGWMSDQQYTKDQVRRIVMPRNSFLLALTDGVIERSKTTGELLGMQGISRQIVPPEFRGLTSFMLNELLNEQGYTKVHDDMLTVTLGFYPERPDVLRRIVRAIPQSMEQGSALTRLIGKTVTETTNGKRLAAKAELITGEFINNIIIHAYEGKMDLTPKILVRLLIYTDRLELFFIDLGKKWEYVPQHLGFEDNPQDDFYYLAQSGRGMRIIEEFADKIERRRIEPLNVTMFTLNYEYRKDSGACAK